MKYLSLLLLSILLIPIVQVAHAQNIVEEIGQAFNNLTSGMMGGNQTSGNASSAGSGNQTSGNASSAGSGNQTSGNASSAGSGNQTSGNASSAGSGNQTSADVGSIQELQNLTSGNQELLTNNTSIAGENTSMGQGMEQEQYVEPENQSNALSGANNTQ
jgi:hypothetical protein